MSWEVIFHDDAIKQLRKLDKRAQAQIAKYVLESLETTDNPGMMGKRLKGKLSAFWRYRTGDYRLLCEIKDEQLVLLVVEVRHRKEVYD